MIGNVYRPPQGKVKNFTDVQDNLYEEISHANRASEIFILGDFNFNYKSSSNPETKTLKWFEQRSGLKQVTSYKRYHKIF